MLVAVSRIDQSSLVYKMLKSLNNSVASSPGTSPLASHILIAFIVVLVRWGRVEHPSLPQIVPASRRFADE